MLCDCGEEKQRWIKIDNGLEYRKSEPESLPRETSQILGKVFTALRKEGVAKSDIAAELHVTDEELDEMVFGLVLNAVKRGAGQEVKPARSKPDLHLVS